MEPLPTPSPIIDAVPGTPAMAPPTAELSPPIITGISEDLTAGTPVEAAAPPPVEEPAELITGFPGRVPAVEVVTPQPRPEAPLGSLLNPNVVPFVSGTAVSTLSKAANMVLGNPAGNLDAIRAAAAAAATPAKHVAVEEALLRTR